MLTGFEDITAELTDYEKNVVVPIIVRGLKTKIGRRNSISNRQIRNALLTNPKYQIEVKDVRMRLLISYIRICGLLPNLVAGGNGYFVAETIEEVDNHVESLNQRVQKIEMVIKQLEYQKLLIR